MRYSELVSLYEKLDSTSKRLEKTYHISEILKTADPSELKDIVLLIQGKLFHGGDDTKIGIASKLVIKALTKATGTSEKQVEQEWKKKGDLGDVALNILASKKQHTLFPKELTLKYVIDSLQQLATFEGKGSVDIKLNLLSDLLINSTPKEAKYIVRTVLDNLRVGIGSGTFRDAMAWAFYSEDFGIRYDKEKGELILPDNNRETYNDLISKLQLALDLTNDPAYVLEILKKEGSVGLDKIGITLGKPINLMLYQKASSVKEAFEIVGKPAAFEYKYDGFRMQAHKEGNKVRLFTRRLDEVTDQFPDAVKAINENISSDKCILDAEAIGYNPKTGRYVPFQKISQRIKRKYDIDKLAEEFPVEVNVFDIIYLEGETLLGMPFKERRKKIESILSEKDKQIVAAKQIITSDEEEAQRFYEESLALGEEGVMAKNLESIYKPGSRVGYGVKIKPILEPLDLVIVAAEYGEGKRSGMLTSFYLACQDENGELLEVGKVSTGLKELDNEDGVTFRQMTNLLLPLVTESEGKIVEVRPKIVIEVGYEEIQKSMNYSSGYALRFPRFLRLRTDEKTVDDINTIDDLEAYYVRQRGRNS